MIGSTSAASAWIPEMRALSRLAWPIVVTNLGQIALQVSDVLMIGRFLGGEKLAPTILATNVYSIFLLVGIGVVSATAPMLAQEFGRRQSSVRIPRLMVQQGLLLSTVLSLAAIACTQQADLLLLALGQEPQVSAEAAGFLRAIMWGTAPALWSITLRLFITSLERPRAGSAIMIATLIFNIAASYALITGSFGLPSMGLVGAAAATALANLFQCLALMAFIHFDRRLRRYSLLRGLHRIDMARMADYLRIGLPISMTLLLEMSMFAGAAFAIGQIGTAALAAHQIAMQCVSITFTIPLAIGQASTIRVGLAIGRGDPSGARRSGLLALLAGALYAFATAAIFVLLSHSIVQLFLSPIDRENQEILRIAAGLVTIAGLFQFFDSGQAIALGALRGLKDTTTPVAIAAISYLGVGFGSAGLLTQVAHLGARGIWLGLALGLLCAGLGLAIRFLGLTSRLSRLSPLAAVAT